jgi:hypothetical protein
MIRPDRPKACARCAELEYALNQILKQFPIGYDCRITELAGGALTPDPNRDPALQPDCAEITDPEGGGTPHDD